MAYDASKYQLTKLLQDAWYRLGQFKTWIATGGSTTTAVNADWAGVEEQIYEDDDPALIYGTLVVVRDAAGAAPEGEFGMITDYDAASQTITMDAISAAIAAGDRIGIASPLFPLEDMIRLANIAMRRIGEVELPDTSITTAAGQTEYTLPSSIRSRPIAVYRRRIADADNNDWVLVQGWSVIPATAGANWTLVIPPTEQGITLKIMYRAIHPELTAFDSPILETIHPELILTALLVEAYQWYNNQVGGSNTYFIQRENKALQDFEQARVIYAPRRSVEQVQGLPHWNARGEYVPGTSDLRA